MPQIGEILQCKQERGNPEDLYTLASWKVTPSLAWPDPSQSHRGVIACSASDNVPVSGHVRLGYT